jgi:hypothetical protein
MYYLIVLGCIGYVALNGGLYVNDDWKECRRK